jgi:dihydroorotate dehydrogenase (fumarate)
LKLRNPLIVGSSVLTDSAEKNAAWDEVGCGAIVLPSLFEEQIELESKRIMKKEKIGDGSQLVWNFVKSTRIMNYLDLIRGSKNSCSIPIIASIHCYSDGGWIEFAAQIESAGADALELNISAIEANPEVDPMESAVRYISIVQKIKSVVGIPVIVKASKLFNNIPWLVNRLKQEGADAVVLFNKLYPADIDIDLMKATSGPILSHPEDVSDTLRWICLTASRVPGVDLAASTGVHSWQDVVKCILVGASAVQIVSALYPENGKEFVPDTLSRISEWMKSKDFISIDRMKGLFHIDKQVDVALFERAQFMKYFTNFH